LLEARALVETAGTEPPQDGAALVRAVAALGPRYVVVTGGHADGEEAVDLFFDGAQLTRIPSPRFEGGAAHGSGCTHSSVLAAYLALGHDPLEGAPAANPNRYEPLRRRSPETGEAPTT